jgi:Transglutaminase-like superfamily
VRALIKLRSPAEALLALQIFAFAAIVPCLTRLRLDRLRRLVTPRGTRAPAGPDIVARTIRYVEGVRALGTPIIDGGCLTRGLTLYYFLRRAGVDVALCFGVANGNADAAFTGHCWLEREGEPYLEPGAPPRRYTEMYRFPSALSGGAITRR